MSVNVWLRDVLNLDGDSDLSLVKGGWVSLLPLPINQSVPSQSLSFLAFVWSKSCCFSALGSFDDDMSILAFSIDFPQHLW